MMNLWRSLSLGRRLPNTDAWTNLVRMSEGLRWVPIFSSDMTPSLGECPESTNAWALCALTSLKCQDVRPSFFLLMSLSLELFSHPLKESLIWVPWWSAWSPMNRLMPESWQWSAGWPSWSLTSGPIWIWIRYNFYWNEPLRICCWNLRLHDIDIVSSLIDILEKMNEVVEVDTLGIDEWPWQFFDRELDVISELRHPQELANSCPEFWVHLLFALDLIFFWNLLNLDSICRWLPLDFEKT